MMVKDEDVKGVVAGLLEGRGIKNPKQLAEDITAALRSYQDYKRRTAFKKAREEGRLGRKRVKINIKKVKKELQEGKPQWVIAKKLRISETTLRERLDEADREERPAG